MAFKFQGLDFLQFDSLLSEEERMVRDNVRAFVEDNLIPIIESCNRDGRFPRELVLPMGALGFYGATIDGYGCAGMNNVEYGLLTQELERGDSGLRSFVSVQSALVMYPIYAFGTEEQKNHWLPKLATGEKLGCFGLTEPDFGSNPGDMRTRARQEGDDYILNGEKMWITSGSIADVAVIWATRPTPSADSWSRPTGPAFPRTTSMENSPCAPRSRPDFRCRTCASPLRICCRRLPGSSPL